MRLTPNSSSRTPALSPESSPDHRRIPSSRAVSGRVFPDAMAIDEPYSSGLPAHPWLARPETTSSLPLSATDRTHARYSRLLPIDGHPSDDARHAPPIQDAMDMGLPLHQAARRADTVPTPARRNPRSRLTTFPRRSCSDVGLCQDINGSHCRAACLCALMPGRVRC